MKVDVPRLVIAAPASGSGKTTVTMGLIAALAHDLRVQAFKVGPDYIDPGYHTAASGRPARNLDTWMVPHSEVLRSFARAAADADLALIEGVMGLFDGYEGASESGSTAELAKLLRAPVVLVVNAGKMARSAGALALGFHTFDTELRLAGVICNNVASPAHARWVTEAIQGVGLPVLGCVPRSDALRLPERHLGLQTAIEQQASLPRFLQHVVDVLRIGLDLDAIRALARSAPALDVDLPASAVEDQPVKTRIAVAHDEAFCFYYEDNLDHLRAAGAQIVTFSPLRDRSLPTGAAGIYLGGGYPELFVDQLADNQELQRAILAAHKAGMPIYAECGGLMYLTERITGLDGQTYPMVGLLPGRASLSKRLTMGYRTITAARDSLLLRRGEQTRGHEFHYSEWLDRPTDAPAAYQVAPRSGQEPRTEGFAHGELLASYVHVHFGAHPQLAPRFVDACCSWAHGECVRPGHTG